MTPDRDSRPAPPADSDTSLTLAELQGRQYQLLKLFTWFCEENKLSYVLSHGTLLGAARHRGFIPWDDDIDLAMPRRDYERLLTLGEKIEADTGQVLRYSQGRKDPYPYPYAKFMDTETVLVEFSATAVPLSVNIDIFPVDGWPQHTLHRHLRRRILRFLQLVIVLKGWCPAGESAASRVLRRAVQVCAKPVPPWVLVRAISGIARRTDLAHAADAGVIVWAYQEQIPTEAWAAGPRLRFVDADFTAPEEYDQILSTLYGDYMTLPPEEKQVTHHTFHAHLAPTEPST